MTPEQAKELLPVIQAFADGAAIEWTHGRTPEWFTTKFPSWDAEYKYRIKPKPTGSERVKKMLGSGKPVLCGVSTNRQCTADNNAEKLLRLVLINRLEHGQFRGEYAEQYTYASPADLSQFATEEDSE